MPLLIGWYRSLSRTLGKTLKRQMNLFDGQVLDPLSGHVYQGKGHLFNTRGNVLATLRGFIDISLLGRHRIALD